jgi:hypothetical protein
MLKGASGGADTSLEEGDDEMATIEPLFQLTPQDPWSDQAKMEWLAAHGSTPTHVVTFEPLFQVEVCVPPWESPDRQIAHSAVVWGTTVNRVLNSGTLGSVTILASHHEGNCLEISKALVRQSRWCKSP